MVDFSYTKNRVKHINVPLLCLLKNDNIVILCGSVALTSLKIIHLIFNALLSN
jgi:hypothetical protein